jgi:four helix bundle protein
VLGSCEDYDWPQRAIAEIPPYTDSEHAMPGDPVRPAPFQSLGAWQLAHKLAIRIYLVTAKFPTQHRFGLALQLQRAASAIPANLAEGNARWSAREYLYFCKVAKGSISEVRYFLQLGHDLGIISDAVFSENLDGYDKLGAVVYRLIGSLKGKLNNPPEKARPGP